MQKYFKPAHCTTVLAYCNACIMFVNMVGTAQQAIINIFGIDGLDIFKYLVHSIKFESSELKCRRHLWKIHSNCKWSSSVKKDVHVPFIQKPFFNLCIQSVHIYKGVFPV